MQVKQSHYIKSSDCWFTLHRRYRFPRTVSVLPYFVQKSNKVGILTVNTNFKAKLASKLWVYHYRIEGIRKWNISLIFAYFACNPFTHHTPASRCIIPLYPIIFTLHVRNDRGWKDYCHVIFYNNEWKSNQSQHKAFHLRLKGCNLKIEMRRHPAWCLSFQQKCKALRGTVPCISIV
jgi:hypothetical protein